MATNPQRKRTWPARLPKYQNDLNPLKVYPIVSFGVAYNFGIRKVDSAKAAFLRSGPSTSGWIE